MKPFRVIPCESEEHLEKYVAFVHRHKAELYPTASAKQFISLLCNQFRRGNIVIGLDGDDELMGAFVYTFGTPYQEYKDAEVVLVNIALLRPDYRNTFAFICGMTAVMECIERSGSSAKEIHFLAYREHPYLHKIYAKFAIEHEGISDRWFKGYRVSFSDYRNFCKRFGRKGLT